MKSAYDFKHKRIAKITSTMLGHEEHGMLTCFLFVDYGLTAQGVGGYKLDGGCHIGRWIKGILGACGGTWEDLPGRTIYVLMADDGWNAKPIGLAPLPTEKGEVFLFAEE